MTAGTGPTGRPARRRLRFRGTVRVLASAVLALAALAAGARPAPAQEKPPPPPTVQEQADAVLAAVRAKDAKKLATLADALQPDAWLVADLLCSRSEKSPAAEFAKSSKRKDIAALPAWIAAYRAPKEDAGLRAASAAAEEALKAGDAEGALAAVEAAKPRGDDVVSTLLLHQRGAALRAAGRFQEGAEAFRTSADAAERLGWLVRAAASHNERGICGLLLGDSRVAADGFERRLAVEEKRERPRGIADSLANAGAAYTNLGENERAAAVFERALRIYEELGAREAMPMVLANLAAVRSNRGEYAAALEVGRRAATLGEEVGQKEHVAVAEANCGLAHMHLGELPRARECMERALSIHRELGDRGSVAADIADLATVSFRGGHYRRAIELAGEALAEFEALGQEGKAAEVLANLGGSYLALGEYGRALDHMERALAAHERLGAVQSTADTLMNLGVAYAELGDVARWRDATERALAKYESIGYRKGVADCLANLGTAWMGEDDDRAVELLERARKLSEEIGFASAHARSIANLALIRRNRGDAEASLADSREALARAEAAGERDGAARILGQIGATYHTMGDEEKALEYLQRALAQAEEIGAQELVVGTLTNLALTRFARREHREAAAAVRRAIGEMRILVTGVGDEQAAAAREMRELLYTVGVAAAAKLGDAAEVSYFLESGRAGALLESLKSRDALRAAAVPEELRTAEAKARAAEGAALRDLRAALDGKKVAEIARARKAVKTAQDGLREAIARIQREAKAAAGLLYPEADTLDAIRGRLREGEALVLYGRFSHDRSGALVVTREGARIADLGPTKEIDTTCAALALEDPSVDAAPALDALAKLVVAPLGLDAKTKRVLVSPHGALSYVPFSLLLGERETASIPSATAYGLLLAEAKQRGEGVLALGDPDYASAAGGRGAVALRGYGELAALPATRVEAKAVGDVVLVGKEATEAGLRTAVTKRPRWHALHLACHGLVDPERPTLSSLALTPSGEDDGFLTALEVFQSKLPADLVVLSACETGKGKVYRTEGIVGLTRAFMFAGAPRVVVSLWKVDDEATAALMGKFHEAWKKGVPAAKALRDAQAHVRSQEKWRHPNYWAAWVLWGLPE